MRQNEYETKQSFIKRAWEGYYGEGSIDTEIISLILSIHWEMVDHDKSKNDPFSDINGLSF